jgi:hypothetical protein
MHKPNKFYQDPIDQWFEDHPYLGTLLAFIGGWGLIVIVFSI